MALWRRYLLQSAMAAIALSALAYLLKEPVSWTQFLVWFTMSALMFIGPALSKHYHTPSKQLKEKPWQGRS